MKKSLPRTFCAALLLFTVAFLFATVCAAADQNNKESYIVDVDDIMTVTIFSGGKAQESIDLKVTADGTVNFPFLGKVKVIGLTMDQVIDKVTTPLARDFFVDPQVIIKIKEIQKIYVLGTVNRPGAFDYQEGLTALEAVTLAGGFAKYAAPNRTKITRRNKDGTQTVIDIDLDDVRNGEAKDVFLRSGDRVYVPKSWF